MPDVVAGTPGWLGRLPQLWRGLAIAIVAVTIAALVWIQIWDAFRLLGIVE
jgi:hypothetical protein